MVLNRPRLVSIKLLALIAIFIFLKLLADGDVEVATVKLLADGAVDGATVRIWFLYASFF
jgi:hypothetical protein